MLKPELRQLIDACRPGSRDIDLPEMAPLAQALSDNAPQSEGPGSESPGSEIRRAVDSAARLDARITTAMHEVAIPAGLNARLLAALAAAAAPAKIPSADSAVAEPALSQLVALRENPADSLRNRRRWLRQAAALAACLLVAASVVVWNLPSSSGTPDLPNDAAAWYQRLPDQWQPLAKAPRGFSLPAGLAAVARGWQSLPRNAAGSFAGQANVVFDLAPGRAEQGAMRQAVLFVFKGQRAGLSAALPRSPQSTTAGLAISAWQSGGRVYVLVVRGSEQDYRKFILPGAPLA